MTLAALLKAASVFVPGLTPLAPDIVKAAATIEKFRAVMAPVRARLANNEPAFLELAEVAPALNAMLPDLVAAIGTYEALAALAASTAAKIKQEEKS
jgi:hypothetical protein